MMLALETSIGLSSGIFEMCTNDIRRVSKRKKGAGTYGSVLIAWPLRPMKAGITKFLDGTALFLERPGDAGWHPHLTNRLTRAVAGFTAEDTFGCYDHPPASQLVTEAF